jgi:excisionase family DNA binding protein
MNRSQIPTFHPIASVAASIGVSTKTISRWISAGELPAHKLGSQWRVSSEDLRTFIALRRQ